MKAKNVADLERVLQEELKLYEAYALSLKKDMEYMAQLKIDALEQANKEKNTLLLKIQTLDQARQNLVHQLGIELGLPTDQIRVTDLCEKISKEDGERLLRIRNRLHEVVRQIQAEGERAQMLANGSLSWMNSAVTKLQSLLTPHSTYSAVGKVDGHQTFVGRMVVKQV